MLLESIFLAIKPFIYLIRPLTKSNYVLKHPILIYLSQIEFSLPIEFYESKIYYEILNFAFYTLI